MRQFSERALEVIVKLGSDGEKTREFLGPVFDETLFQYLEEKRVVERTAKVAGEKERGYQLTGEGIGIYLKLLDTVQGELKI